MPSSGFPDVYPLDTKTIDQVVTVTSPGAYVLTRQDASQTFIVNYVGRSDGDMNARLKTHAATGKYSHFKAGYLPSAKAAFDKECQLFHDFGGTAKLDNAVHPARPANAAWLCPICTVYD